ncbi:MAG: NADH oxidase [Candidatus Jorgensenbacteria bacterium GW2011_GWA1_48_11]|uniref:NADH oxidase n=1 Tax=Candidatus Jorgensenbacteria bacterium GW2011_GWA1_48_11 TaxID=1618660 RepID=A0A0G1WM93_9BACT|nr:MAG: NADH oxidase [Candidatus Jorgensenbacteria bacterium GW2011_GWA1_48_11]KKW11951.1 MAG: NADH oxidase [Candidatus Jorgensenbacteria bacterium GW2011_GWB1_49_9]
MVYDLVIVGGGPAGVAAGVYAARKKIRTVLITDSFGGQSLVSADVQNWIGVKSISGFDLAKALEDHLRAQEGVEILDSDRVSKIEKIGVGFRLATDQGKILEVKTVLLATGSSRKKLGVPGEKEFEGRGVVYCSTCDAPIFKNMTVAVVGGGNAGLEAVNDLLPYAKKIYLLQRSGALKGDPEMQDKIKANSKVEIILNADTKEVFGDEILKGLRYLDGTSGQKKELDLSGVFVEIGIVPNSALVKDLVSINQKGEIVTDPKTQATSEKGIWAAGDVTDGLYRQNNISAGDSVKAVLNIYDFLNKKK